MNTTEPINATGAGSSSLNRYAPVPRNGQQCCISGFGHTRFYQKVSNGPGREHVRILDTKSPGQKRGTKFFHVGDLLAWLDSLATKGSK